MDAAPGLMPASKTLQAILFGSIFGVLLQKGGVAKYNVLEDQLLLRDFTVVKVMASAILVAMIGIFALHKFAGTKMHVKPTKIGANILGGLIFGAGFAFAGYCPGTSAAALGQGELLAVITMCGLVAGSYAYAEASKFLKRTIEGWGDLGKLELPSVAGVSAGAFVAVFAVFLIGALFALDRIQR